MMIKWNCNYVIWSDLFGCEGCLWAYTHTSRENCWKNNWLANSPRLLLYSLYCNGQSVSLLSIKTVLRVALLGVAWHLVASSSTCAFTPAQSTSDKGIVTLCIANQQPFRFRAERQ